MPKFDEEESVIEKHSRGARGSRGGSSFFSSLVQKAKNAPAHYWVIGLGVSALAVDYLVEGENSLAAAAYRGVFGGGHEEQGPHAHYPHAGRIAQRGSQAAPGGGAGGGQGFGAPGLQAYGPAMGSMGLMGLTRYGYPAPSPQYFQARAPIYPTPHHQFGHGHFGPGFHSHGGGRGFGHEGHGHHLAGGYTWE